MIMEAFLILMNLMKYNVLQLQPWYYYHGCFSIDIFLDLTSYTLPLTYIFLSIVFKDHDINFIMDMAIAIYLLFLM